MRNEPDRDLYELSFDELLQPPSSGVAGRDFASKVMAEIDSRAIEPKTVVVNPWAARLLAPLLAAATVVVLLTTASGYGSWAMGSVGVHTGQAWSWLASWFGGLTDLTSALAISADQSIQASRPSLAIRCGFAGCVEVATAVVALGCFALVARFKMTTTSREL